MRGVLQLFAPVVVLDSDMEGYLAGFACWLSVSTSFHFLIRSAVEFFSSQPNLNLTVLSTEGGSYRGALQPSDTTTAEGRA
jgi:hypothetical protein